MLTNKGKYGLKALAHLAKLEPGETAFVSEIALENNISKKFLDAILLELRKAGMLRSKKGPGGGYALARPASEITIGQAVRVLDGPLAPIRCASRTVYEPCADCANPDACHVRRSMTLVRDAIASVLDGMTLQQFMAMPDAEAEFAFQPTKRAG
ncbi:RrF2 family transcriptional regulator [Rhizobium rhizogenes]|uniref:RrF2 family transcriptional regulator n=1 Tax=Rhizobium rhizogenes TaxID=359 RepID=UPI0015735A82|nr:Rrf2 family transcriptional regulator [Rhizobium rhizogenes]NTI78683.1 Rrf2 family transcriptional regulator [Rhizobium rhizogenes]